MWILREAKRSFGRVKLPRYGGLALEKLDLFLFAQPNLTFSLAL